MIEARKKRARTIRHRLSHELPRITVFRSNKRIYAQVIDDTKGETIAYAAATFGEKEKKRVDQAREVGTQIAEKLIAMKIKKVVFDRGGYKYHGLIKTLADGAREGGLQF